MVKKLFSIKKTSGFKKLRYRSRGQGKDVMEKCQIIKKVANCKEVGRKK